MNQPSIALEHNWQDFPPQHPGKYLWRAAEGRPELNVEAMMDWSIRGELAMAWLCYDTTDFDEMTSGGQWLHVRENTVGSLSASYIAALCDPSKAWSSELPIQDGRYLWRGGVSAAPALIKIHHGTSNLTGNKERFITSYAHGAPENFETLLTSGQWIAVDQHQPW